MPVIAAEGGHQHHKVALDDRPLEHSLLRACASSSGLRHGTPAVELDPVSEPFGALHACTVSAAEETTVGLHAMAYDLHAAVLAGGGQGVNRAFEGIKGVRAATGHADLESLIVLVAAHVALGHDYHPLESRLGDTLTPFLSTHVYSS